MSSKTEYICNYCGKSIKKDVENIYKISNGIFQITISIKNPNHLRQSTNLDFCNVECFTKQFKGDINIIDYLAKQGNYKAMEQMEINNKVVREK